MSVLTATQLAAWKRDGCPATEPRSVVGFCVALQDATIENGCRWAQPGRHRTPCASASCAPVIEGGAGYPAENRLQRSPQLPLRGFT